MRTSDHEGGDLPWIRAMEASGGTDAGAPRTCSERRPGRPQRTSGAVAGHSPEHQDSGCALRASSGLGSRFDGSWAGFAGLRSGRGVFLGAVSFAPASRSGADSRAAASVSESASPTGPRFMANQRAAARMTKAAAPPTATTTFRGMPRGSQRPNPVWAGSRRTSGGNVFACFAGRGGAARATGRGAICTIGAASCEGARM